MEEAIDADDVPVEPIVFEYLTRIIDLVVEFNAGHEDFADVADEEQDDDADQHHGDVAVAPPARLLLGI